MVNEEITFGGLYNSQAENRTPKGRAYSMSNCFVDNGVLEVSKRYASFGSRTTASSGDIGWGLGYGRYSGNEVQVLSLTGIVTGGSITLRWRPNSSSSYQTTAAIPFNTSASGVLGFLEALSNIEPGDLKLTGGPLPGQIKISFQRQYANTDVDMIELVTSTLSGISPGVQITEEVKGGTSEEYVAVVQHASSVTSTLYTVDVNTGLYTFIASGLHSSDWYFAQYQQRIWAVNHTDGVNFKNIGGTWNDGVSGVPPIAPGVKPSFSIVGTTSVDNWTGYTYSVSGPTSSTKLYALGGGLYIQNTGSSLTSATSCIVMIDYGTNQDWSHQDFWTASWSNVTSNATPVYISSNSLKLSVVNAASGEIVPTYNFWYANDQLRDDLATTFTNQQRSSRATSRKLKLTFIVSSWPSSSWCVVDATRGHVWMGDKLPLPGFDNPGPSSVTKAKMEYAYSYFNSSNSQESDLSPSNTTTSIPTGEYGCWVQLGLTGSTELTTNDRIYVYRKRKADNTWRRLPQDAANLTVYGATNASGSVTFTDKWMEAELEDFPTFGKGGFPGTSSGVYADQIGVWKQCLVVGAVKQAWISFVGQPTQFVASPDDLEATLPGEDELDRGKTEYVSDNRSEEVYGIHGQDSLYLITPLSTYSIIGDTPAESTPPRRLPQSRGTLGKRSSFRLGGGLLSAAEDGLWYYSVGRGFSGEDNGALVAREETEQVRRSYFTTLLGSVRSGSGIVAIEYDDEVWVFNGTRYMVNTRNKQWLEGTFSNSVKAATAVRHLPLRFLDSTGKMFSISKDYMTDAGSSVTWSYSTGLLDGSRSRIRTIELRGQGTPSVTFSVYDGKHVTQTLTLQPSVSGQNYITPVKLQPGSRYRLTFQGTGTDTIEYASLGIDQAPGGPKIGDLTLDAWNVKEFLPERYSRFGFKEYGRDEYNVQEYGEPSPKLKSAWRQDGWKDGEPYPSVVYMRYEGPLEPGAARTDYLRTGAIDGSRNRAPDRGSEGGLHPDHVGSNQESRSGDISQGIEGRDTSEFRDSSGNQGTAHSPLDSFSRQYRDLHLFSDEELQALGIDPTARGVEPLPEEGTHPLTTEEKNAVDAGQGSFNFGESSAKIEKQINSNLEYGSKNKLVTRAQYEETKQNFLKRIGKVNMNVDPELLSDVFKMAVFHAEAGVKSFGHFVQKLKDDLGVDVVTGLKEHLPDIWDRARMKANNFRDPHSKVPKDSESNIDINQFELEEKYREQLKNIQSYKASADTTNLDVAQARKEQLENQLLEQMLRNRKEAVSKEGLVDGTDLLSPEERLKLRLEAPKGKTTVTDVIHEWLDTILHSHYSALPEVKDILDSLKSKFDLDSHQVSNITSSLIERNQYVDNIYDVIKNTSGLGEDGTRRPMTRDELVKAISNPFPDAEVIRWEDVNRKLNQADSDTVAALVARIKGKEEAVTNLIEKSKSRQLIDQVSTIYKGFMLLSFKGPINNFISNALNSMALTGSRPIRGTVDLILGKATGQRTRLAGFQSPWEGLGQVVNKEVGTAMLEAINGVEQAPSKFDYSRIPGASSGTFKPLDAVEAVASVGFKLASAGDKPFFSLGYNKALEEMAKLTAVNEKLTGQAKLDRIEELVNHPTDAMIVDATLQADYSVLANKNVLADAVTKGKAELKKGGVGSKLLGGTSEFLLPFVKIPLNAAGRAIEFSGGGLFEGSYKLGNYFFKRVKVESAATGDKVAFRKVISPTFIKEAFTMMPPSVQREIADNIGNGLTGFGLITLGYLGYKAGKMKPFGKGSYNDYNKDVALGEAGGAWNINGYDIDLKSSVIGRAMAMGATIAAWDDGKMTGPEAAGAAFKGVSDNPVLQGTNLVSKLTDKPVQGVLDYVAQQAPSVVEPGFIREGSRLFSPNNPVTENGSLEGGLSSYWNEISDRLKIPFGRGSMQTRTDVFGFKDTQTFWQYIFSFKANRNNPVAKELDKLDIQVTKPQQSKKNDVKYGDVKTGIKDSRYDRNAQDYADRVAFIGMRVYQEMGNLLQDPSYKDIPVAEKKAYIRQLISQVREASNQELDDMRMRLGYEGAKKEVWSQLERHQ